MTYLLLFGLVASAIAAPQYYHPDHGPHFGPPPFSQYYHHMRGYGNGLGDSFGENIFDGNRFWEDMANEMRKLDDMLSDMRKHFPITTTSQQGVVGNEYVITISLTGYQEKDIVVKAREGQLMIQAVHQKPDGSQNSYLDVRTLPNTLVMNGIWVYKDSILKITFPLKEGVKNVEPVTDAAIPVTESSLDDSVTGSTNVDREEIEEDQNNGPNGNADVDGPRGDLDTGLYNVVSNEGTVEATTYAVDLKNEVEFVPVRY